MDGTGKKFVSLLLTFIMVFSTLAIVGNTTAKQPDDVPADGGENGIPDVQITELRAKTSVIYIDQENHLVLSVFNQGNATALKVTANVTDIIPKVSEELISTEHFGALKPDMERSRFIDWTPTTRGIHYIKVEIKYEYLTHNSPAEMVESPPTTLSAGFPVTLAGPEEYWGPFGDYPSIITSTEGARYRDGPLTIYVEDDLLIQTGAKLQLNETVTLVMTQPALWPDDQYDITIHPSASFIISSPSRTTTIQSPSSNPQYTYPFHTR